MTTVTIPKELARKGDLVLVPRKEYEELLLRGRKFKTVKMTAAQKRDLVQARREYAQGKYVTLEELKHELGIAPARAR
jgi:hypothetical protein